MDREQEELRVLRSGVRDLTALSALPLTWVGKDVPAVALSFVDILLASLRADLAYARFEDPRGDCQIEVARAEGDARAAERTQEIGLALTPAHASLNGASGSVVVSNPLNNRNIRIAFVPLRTGAQGVVVAVA